VAHLTQNARVRLSAELEVTRRQSLRAARMPLVDRSIDIDMDMSGATVMDVSASALSRGPVSRWLKGREYDSGVRRRRFDVAWTSYGPA
jgi:hypothetical protein